VGKEKGTAVSKPGFTVKPYGHLDKGLVETTFPRSDDALAFVCGPPAFYETVSGKKAPDYTQGELSGILAELGWKKEQVFKL